MRNYFLQVFEIIFISWLFIIGDWKVAAGAEFTDFGPYRGKIVDAETKEPIEGAVIFIEWVKLHAFGGSTFIDGQETLTDKNGEFYISGIWVFNPWKRLTSEAEMTIYKSGYQGIVTGAWKNWNIFRPKLEYVLKVEDGKPVFLVKRLTIEERKQAPLLGDPAPITPDEKKRLLLQEMEKDYEFKYPSNSKME